MRKVTTSMLALVALTACGRKGARSSDFDSATAAALAAGGAAADAANLPKVAHVAGFNIGHQLDRHNMIFGGAASRFNLGDSILVSVRGVYVAAGTEVGARIRQKNVTMDSASAKTEAADSAGFSFAGLRFAAGAKWKKGAYSVDVFLDGKFQMSQDITVGQ